MMRKALPEKILSSPIALVVNYRKESISGGVIISILAYLTGFEFFDTYATVRPSST